MKTIPLEFEGHERVDVIVSPVPVDDLFGVLELLEAADTRKGYEALCKRFATYVESWAYPEAPDVTGLMRRDVNHLFALVNGWRDGVRDVPLPLPLPSSGGTPSEAEEATPSP